MKKERTKRSLCSRLACLALAAAMMFSMIGVMPETVSAAEKKLKAKGGTVKITDEEVMAAADGTVHWIKYKPNADGYLQLKFSPKSSLQSYPLGKVQLFDGKKKKTLSSVTRFWTEDNSAVMKTECYGVKKKQNYYIGVVASAGISIKATFKKASDKSGTSQGKSLNLQRKKAVTGVIQGGTGTAHCYKFTLTKPSKFKVIIKPFLTGDIKFTISAKGAGSASGLIRARSYRYNYDGTVDVYSNNWGKNTPAYDSGSTKYKAATYYLKVQPTTKTCTGYYTIQWQ